MASSIGQSIDALCSEHSLDREMIIEAMTDAVKAAARKQFKSLEKNSDNIQVEWNEEEGMVEISALKEVVEEVENHSIELSLEEAQELAGEDIEIGDELLIPLPTEELGRIAAQTAKQILVQKVREAIREKVYDEYIDRKGDLMSGTIKRFERGDMIVDLGGTLEAILPRKEQVRNENWNQGERIRFVVEDVTKDPKGQQIIASRTSSELIRRLFETEVPEIYDNIVMIKSAVREPGERAKIAVASNEKDVDPVGACVGMKGSRVQSIIKELRGEKIDIIEWSQEPSVFAANALSPAKVSQVRIVNIDRRKMEVVVGEDQLSLAIGKKGQNVRLATRLVGWDIDIKNETVLKKEIAQQMGKMMSEGEEVPISALEGVTSAQADDLKVKGINDVEALATSTVDELVDTLDISMDEAERILSSAKAIVAVKNSAKEAADNPEESTNDSALAAVVDLEVPETVEIEASETEVVEVAKPAKKPRKSAKSSAETEVEVTKTESTEETEAK
jgi:transcription termination/antitermination protein NusA